MQQQQRVGVVSQLKGMQQLLLLLQAVAQPGALQYSICQETLGGDTDRVRYTTQVAVCDGSRLQPAGSGVYMCCGRQQTAQVQARQL